MPAKEAGVFSFLFENVEKFYPRQLAISIEQSLMKSLKLVSKTPILLRKAQIRFSEFSRYSCWSTSLSSWSLELYYDRSRIESLQISYLPWTRSFLADPKLVGWVDREQSDSVRHRLKDTLSFRSTLAGSRDKDSSSIWPAANCWVPPALGYFTKKPVWIDLIFMRDKPQRDVSLFFDFSILIQLFDLNGWVYSFKLLA